MSLTELQRVVCKVIAANRLEQGESYVAGRAAINTLIGAARRSRDLDLFHDTDEALIRTWEADRGLLAASGFSLKVIRERRTFVEALVVRGDDSVVLEWIRDSAFRFFPLITHPELGVTLHPYDLATNKVLAAIGRLEVRDWVDLVECGSRLQPLGYLVWGACGKDSMFSPAAILEQLARSSHYSREEVEDLAFDGTPPDPLALSLEWRGQLSGARELVQALPASEVGKCVLGRDGGLFQGSANELRSALSTGGITFHGGRIRGALPTIARASP